MSRYSGTVLLLLMVILGACGENTGQGSKTSHSNVDTKGAWYEALSADQRAKGVTYMMHAAAHGDAVRVRELLKDGNEVNAKDSDGWTALHYSTLGGDGPSINIVGRSHSEVMRELLASGATVNAKTPNGSTALTMSATKGQSEWVRILLQYGADVNAQDAMKRTALINACESGFSDDDAEATVEILLTANPDFTIKDGFGMTALDWAKENKRHRIVRMLRNAGAKR